MVRLSANSRAGRPGLLHTKQSETSCFTCKALIAAVFAATFSLIAYSGTIRVGVCELWDDAETPPSGLFAILDESSQHDAVLLSGIPLDELDTYDVLVVFQPDPGQGLSGSELKALREWVNGGRGLLSVFAAAGREEQAMFPEVASIAGYPCDSKPEYELEEGVVAGISMLTDTYEPGYRYILAGNTYAALDSGADGVVVLRSVEKRADQAFSSHPLLVAGGAGKGRFAAYGEMLAQVKPVGMARAVVFETINWLAHGDGDITVSGGIGMDTDIGASVVNLAKNGDLEEAPNEEGLPPAWALTGPRPEQASFSLSTNAFSGRHSVRFSIPAVQPGESRENIEILPGLITGAIDGPDMLDIHAIPPNSRYKVSFRVKGCEYNKIHPGMRVAMQTWIESSDTPVSIRSPGSVIVSDEWTLYSLDFHARLGEVGRGCIVEIKLAQGEGDELNPDSTVYIDDISIARSYSGVPKGLSEGVTVEDILAGGEIHVVPDWRSAVSKPPLEISDVPGGIPIEFQENILARPMYNPLPAGWKELDLGGDWKVVKFRATTEKPAYNPPSDRGLEGGFWKSDYDDSNWAVRTVPSHWHNDDVPDPDGRTTWGIRITSEPKNFEGVGWYRHRFSVPEDFTGERMILCFEGYDHEAIVYLNGDKVGRDVGYSAPVEFDVTDSLKRGEENVIAVRLFDSPWSSYIDNLHALGGLFNRVTLQARPDVYVSRALITSRLEQELCEIDLRITSAAPDKREIVLKALVAPDPDQSGLVSGVGKAFDVDLGKIVLEPGVNEFSVEIPMQDAARWSPDDPFLYIIQFKAGETVVGKERFGFREFRQEGRFLYLNGKRVLLMGGPAPVLRGIPAMELENRNNIMRRIMLVRKQLHQNCFIPRNSMQASFRQMYDACDELGIMLYDWAGLIGLPTYSSADQHEKWFYRRYNHASVVMYTIGNEMRQTEHLRALNEAYSWFKEHDKQGRPVATLTGGMPKLMTPDTDAVDIHLYPGMINDHPLDMGRFIRSYNRDTLRYHGKNLPFLAFENSGGFYVPYPHRVKPARELLQNEPPGYREELVRILTSEIKDYQMPLGVRWLSLYGIRRYCIDDYDTALERGIDPDKYASDLATIRQRWAVKHVTEQCRRAGDLFQGLGYNWMIGNAVARLNEGDDPDDRIMTKGWEYEDIYRTFITTPGYTEYKRFCNPKFVCLDVFDKNLFSGGRLKTVVYAINDTVKDSKPWAVRVIIRDKTGNRLADSVAETGSVPTFKRKLLPYEWDIPSELDTGIYRIELFMLEDGEIVSDNYYEFFAMNKGEVTGGIETSGKRVALYDPLSEEQAPNGITTRMVLDDLDFDYELVTGLESLQDTDVLIIGAGGFDDVVRDASDAIVEWVRAGGRMLVYEQPMGWGVRGRSLTIPFSPGLGYRPGGGIVADIIAFRHPVFEGIQRSSNWEQWNGSLGTGRQGQISLARIGPLNRTMLATSAVGTPRSSNRVVQMLIAEVKEGSGIILLSQPEAIRRYNDDSVATRYIRNTLRYIVSDEMPYAQGLEGFEIVNVDPHRCGYIDLSMFAELTPDDLTGNILEKADEGLKDCGGLIFRSANGRVVSVDKAIAMLTGDVKFALPDSGKLMFPEWEAEKRRRDTNELGLMKDRMEVVYFLHRVKGAEERELIGSYVFSFEDGSEVEENITGGLNISPVKDKSDIFGARYVGDGFYATRWVNPEPDKALRSISVRMESDTAELQIGGITTYLIREKVHD